jgi:hypothetical protein
MAAQHESTYPKVRSPSAERLVGWIAIKDTGRTPAPRTQKGTLHSLQGPSAELLLHAKVLPQTECFASTECGSSAKKHKMECWTSCVMHALLS